MKNIKKLITVVLLTLSLCMCFMLSGCSKIEGEYKFDSLTYEESGISVEVKAGEKFMGSMTISEDFFTLTLEDDGTVKMKTSMEGGMEEEGTWEKKDSKTLELKFEGDTTIECEIDGKYLIGDYEGVTIKLKKS